jgi:hypothetical protein
MVGEGCRDRLERGWEAAEGGVVRGSRLCCRFALRAGAEGG